MKVFDFNKNGVCQNPNIAFDIKSIKPDYTGYFEIKTARKGNKWANGYSYQFSELGIGGGSGVFLNSEYCEVKLFDTEKEAVLDMLDYMIKYLGLYVKFKKSINPIIILLKDYRNTLLHEQLSLF